MKQNKQKPKIAVFIDQLVLGGVQKTAIEDAKNLKKLGVDVTLLVLMRKGYDNKFKGFSKGVDIRFLSDSYPFFLKYSIKFPIFSFFSTLHVLSPFLAPFVIKKNEFDIIVSHGTTTCFTAQSIKFTKKIPYLAFIYDPMNYILKVAYQNSSLRLLVPILKPFLKYLEKNLINDSEEVLLVSKFHQDFISKTYKTKTTILPAAAHIAKKISSSPRNIILASSRWALNKKPDIFLEIAKAVPDAKIVIAGTWSDQDDLIKFKMKVKNNSLEERVKLYQYVSEENLAFFYQKARVFIHPIKEAFGMGGLEAAANGCPIIIPSGSGLTNYLENNKHGIFIEKLTTPNFIQATKKIWENPKLANKMGASARKRVLSLSWENHAKELLKLITKALNKKTVNIVALETGHASESYLSGGDKLLEKMAKFLPENNKITVIIPKIGIKHWQDAKLTNTSLLTLPETFFDNKPSPTLIFIAYLLRIWHSYFMLRKIENIDLIYSSTNVFPDVVPAFLFRLTNNIPWVARIHHLVSPPLKRPGRLTVNMVSYALQMCSNFMIKTKSTKILVLNSMLIKILKNQGFPENKLNILGAGIELEKIQKGKPFINKYYDAIFVGRLHPTKGIYDLVEIWEQVIKDKPTARAVIVGGGTQNELKKIVSQIKNANLQKNLILSGYLSEANLVRTLKSSKIFLFTDYEAGWGLAIAEAMAAGLPTVGYNLEVFGNVFKKGFITVPVGNKKEFAQKILYLLNNDKEYLHLKNETVQESKKLSWEKTSYNFQKIIKGELRI